MVARWFLGFAFALQVFTAVNAADYKSREQIIKDYDKAFAQSRKNIDYVNDFKNGRLDTLTKQINSQTTVQTTFKDATTAASTGGKVVTEATVIQKPNSAKVASTLAARLASAKDYSKKLGKASIPFFVGSAAFHGLMKGIDYVMDEGGKVEKVVTVDPSALYLFKDVSGTQWRSFDSHVQFYKNSTAKLTEESLARIKTNVASNYSSSYSIQFLCISGSAFCPAGSLSNLNVFTKSSGVSPTYNEPVTDAQLQTALQNALNSNNPALASAIAEAIKAAYTPEFGALTTIGDEATNGLAVGAAKDIKSGVDRAAANHDGTANDGYGKQGYYKITDGEKTIEGYVYPSDTSATTGTTTDSTTVTNPDGSTSTTGTSSGSMQLPAFCDWANVVCEFINWVKEDEQLEEEEPEKIDDSIFSRTFDVDFNMDAACPPNPVWNFNFLDQEWSKEIDITMVCDFFKYLGYALLFASNMTALWIVYSAVVVRDQA